MRSLFILIFLVYTVNLFSQDTKPDWGPLCNVKAGMGSLTPIGFENNKLYYLIHNGWEKKKILSYDLTSKTTEVKKYDTPALFSKVKFLKLIESKGSTRIFYTHIDKKEDKFEILYSTFVNGTFTELKSLYTHQFKKKLTIINENWDLENDFRMSIDSSKMVFTNVLSSKDSRRSEQILVAVFDQNLNLLWDKIQEFSYEDDNIRIRKSFIIDDGKTVFLTATRIRKDKKSRDAIFKITENDLTEYSFELKKGFKPADYLPLYLKEQNKFLIIGLNNNKQIVNGTFTAFLPVSGGEIKDILYTNFKDKRKRDKIVSYEISDVIEFQNGNLQFIVENQYRNYSEDGDISSYTAKDLMVFTLNNEGKLIQTKIYNRKKIINDYKRKNFSFFKYKNQSFLLFDHRITKDDKKKFNLDVSSFHSVGKLIRFNASQEIQHEAILLTTKETQNYFYYNIHTILHNGNLSFVSGKMTSSIFALNQTNWKIKFGTVNLN